jgi:hypothetical protein
MVVKFQEEAITAIRRKIAQLEAEGALSSDILWLLKSEFDNYPMGKFWEQPT